MIRFGPSGIPLSCKGRTLRDGIEDVHNLGLTAMEVQLVRVNVNERYATDEDIGRTVREVPGELVVQLGRRQDRKETLISSLSQKIEKGDVLYSLASGIADDYLELAELGALARELDIELSLHTPYYMDLADADGLAQKSLDSVRWGGMLAEAMGATTVITHLGMFGDLSPKEALARIAKNLRLLRDWYRKNKVRARLGVEASGRQEVVGNRVRARVVKNKVAAPFRVAEFEILFNEGISKVGGILDLAVENGLVDKKGSFYLYGEGRLWSSGPAHGAADLLVGVNNVAVDVDIGR